MIKRSLKSRSGPCSVRCGFTVIELLVTVGVVGLLAALLLPAVQRSREAARRSACVSNLRQMSLATEQFHSVHNRYPQNVGQLRGDCVELLSLHTRLLPYLDHAALVEQFQHPVCGTPAAEPPSAVGNEAMLRQPVEVFVCPSDSVPVGGNSYRACYGTSPGRHATWALDSGRPRPGPDEQVSHFGVFPYGRRTAATIIDGLSNTAFFSERVVGDGDRARYTPWRDVAVAGGDFYFPDDARLGCAALSDVSRHFSYAGHTWLIGDYSQTGYNHVLTPNSQVPDCFDEWIGGHLSEGAMTARSLHPGGVNVAFGDGAVRFVSESVDLRAWRAVASIFGDEVETID